MLPGDSEDRAKNSVKKLNDHRIRHFYDLNRRSGKAIAGSIGWEGKVAWDIYLFYKPQNEWNGGPPIPADWMHQLPDNWADREKYRTGEDLTKGLYNSAKTLLIDHGVNDC